MDFEKIKSAAEGYKADMSAFLRAMISHPSESCEEKEVVACIKAEMEKLGYDNVEVDGLGNVIGWMGDGEKIIAIDSHIDTVGIGNIANWTHDPYEGYEDDEVIYGRGGSDQEGGMASAVYGAKIMKDLDLIPAGYKIMVVGSVQEEDCDGMCWQYIYNKDKIVPEFVISTDGRRQLQGPQGPHGDPRGRQGRVLPWLRPRARRQRHLQDGGHPAGRQGAQREPRRRQRGDKGPREDARPEVQPRALRGRPLPRPRHLHHLSDLLHQPEPLRRG